MHLVLRYTGGGGKKAVFFCATVKAAAGCLFCFSGSRRPPPASIKGFRGRVRCIVPSRLREKAALTRAQRAFHWFSPWEKVPLSHSSFLTFSPSHLVAETLLQPLLTDVFLETPTDAASFFVFVFLRSCLAVFLQLCNASCVEWQLSVVITKKGERWSSSEQWMSSHCLSVTTKRCKLCRSAATLMKTGSLNRQKSERAHFNLWAMHKQSNFNIWTSNCI